MVRVRPSREPPEPNIGSCYLLRSNSQHAWYNVSKQWELELFRHLTCVRETLRSGKRYGTKTEGASL